jgi:ABC-type bacteriocin/lantibiotic exporter with double-glycine peptidase domain
MIRLVQQRAEWDCGVAALQTIAPHLHPAAIYSAVSVIDPKWDGQFGLNNGDMVRLAATFGLALRPTRKYDRDLAGGILRVRGPRLHDHGHFVVLYRGLIADVGDRTIRPWRKYLEAHGARTCTLLAADHLYAEDTTTRRVA